MLWPLADRPRLAAGAPGGTTPVRLIDDDLATSLAPGGRLDILLSAVDFATSPQVDPGGEMRNALCLAVDPDLLVTVNAMTGGYVVNDAPDAGPGTPTHPGAGQDAAVGWLNRLKALAQRMCVAPTTYAQADLDALQRVGDPGLSAIATKSAGDIVDQILGIASTRGATLIGDGPLTGPAVELLSAQGPTVAIGAANSAAEDSATGELATADVRPLRYTPQVAAAPFDPTVGAALAGAGIDPASPSYLDPSLDIPVKHDSQVARRQDALGSLLWRGLHPDTEPRSQILSPPLAWSLQPEDAQAILTSVASTIHAGLAVPRPLAAVIAETNALPPQDLAPLPAAALGNPRGRFDDGVVSGIAAATGRLWGLTAALTTDERTGLTGDPVHRAAARGHAARAEPIRAAGRPQRSGPAAADDRRPHRRRPVRRRHHRQPGRFLHPGHRTQPAAVGVAQRPPGADPGPAADRRAARHVGDRYGRDPTATGLPAAEGADRGALHAACRGRCRTAHRRRTVAGRAGAAFGALQRVRQAAVLHHADRRVRAGRCSPAGGCGTGSAASPTAPTSTGRIPSTSRSPTAGTSTSRRAP